MAKEYNKNIYKIKKIEKNFRKQIYRLEVALFFLEKIIFSENFSERQPQGRVVRLSGGWGGTICHPVFFRGPEHDFQKLTFFNTFYSVYFVFFVIGGRVPCYVLPFWYNLRKKYKICSFLSSMFKKS